MKIKNNVYAKLSFKIFKGNLWTLSTQIEQN